MTKSGQSGTAGLCPVRVGAAFGVFHQDVTHGINIHIAVRPRCRQGVRRQRVPARIIDAFGRVVFRTPVNDKYGTVFGPSAGSGKAQFRFRVIDDDAHAVGVKNCRNNHPGGFTGARRCAAQGRKGFFHHQQVAFVFADDHTETVKQTHFLNVFEFGNSCGAVNV